MSVYLAVAMVVLAFSGVKGYANGTVDGSCTDSSMIPRHGDALPQLGASPYTISVSPTEYNAGTSVTVTLQGASADPFIGFLVLALPADDPTAATIGSFATALHSGNGGAISQDACNGGATHTSTFANSHANRLELVWTAPAPAQGVNITFYATFLQGYSVFYVKQNSSTVEFVEPPTTTTTTMSIATTTMSTTTKPTTTTTMAPETTMPNTTKPTTTMLNTTKSATTTTMPTTTMSPTTMVPETTTSATTQKSTLALVVFSTLLWLMLH